MPDLPSALSSELLGNSIRSYLAAGAAFLAVLAATYLGRRIAIAQLRRLARKTKSDFDDLLVALLGQIRHPELFFVAFFVASRGLHVHAGIDKAVKIAFVFALSVRAVRLLQSIAHYAVGKHILRRMESDPTGRSAMRNLQWLIDVGLWAAGGIFVLDNLGVDVTAVMTGFGIGGIAIALAAQAVLGDLFSALTIFLDKPFKIGDFIAVGGDMGTVEHVGVKTTRVRSLSGELLVMPNADLTSSRIRNYGRMENRRVVFSFGLTYAASTQKLKEVADEVKRIVSGIDKVEFGRVHFKGFGASSLDFEVVYTVLDGDYGLYMDIQQRINLELKDALARAGVEFAYPTRTVFVEKLGQEPAAA